MYLISLWFYSSQQAYINTIIFFVIYPVLGYATIIVSDMGLDIAKSLAPLVVSLGNVVSSSEPLRELRKKLKHNIEKLVTDLGPEVFPELDRRPSSNAVLEKLKREEGAGAQTLEWDEMANWLAVADQIAMTHDD